MLVRATRDNFVSSSDKMLGNAFTARLGSDYDLLFTVEPALAERVLQDGQRFVERVERLLPQGGE
jgi:hypothetical protein